MSLWIGLRRSIAGFWLWSNGGRVRNADTDWANGQPGAGTGDCVVADRQLG